MEKIKFGVNIAAVQPEVLAFAERAEELGYDSLWVGDHIVWHTPVLECLTLLSALAARTRHIRLGTGVLLLPLRHPVVVAKAVATLDYLSSGRVTLGVGIGGENPKEFEACGVAIGERGRRADEGIEIIRRLWAEDRVTYQGRLFQFREITIEPKPAQKPGPPIWVGGRSDAALRRAARRGDGWVAYLVSPERYRESMGKIAAYAAATHRGLSSFEAAHFLFIGVADSREEARRWAARHLGRMYNQPFEALADKYCALGTPQECIEKIEAFVAAGVRHFIFRPARPMADYISQIEAYARAILPHFRTAGG